MADASTRSPKPPAHAATMFATCGGGLLVLLLVRNRDLFTRAIYEAGDPASNSMLTIAAKHFSLLTGHYSRVGFHHPGPAYFYLQAAGEWLLHDVTHIVPAAYNGQVIAVMALNAALLGLALTILYSWIGSSVAVLAAAGVMLIFLAEHKQLVCSTWIPHACFAPFVLLLFAAASVSAGRLRHLWVMVLAGGLLVHGHAEFLVLVPLLALVALIPQWRNLAAHRRDLSIAAAVLAVFLLPIVLNWPGEIPKYIAYGHRAPNPPLDAAKFLVQFWGPNTAIGAVFLIALFVGNFFLVRAVQRLDDGGGPNDFPRHLLRVTAVATALFGLYCWYGVDQLFASYIGIFSYALPSTLLMLASSALVVLANAHQPRVRRVPAGVAGLALVAGVALALTTPGLLRDHDDLAGVPEALRYMDAHAHGRPILLETRTDDSWADALALALAATRDGKRACLTQDRWVLRTTSEFMCKPEELAGGARFTLSRVLPAPPGTPIVPNLNPIPASYPPSAVIAAD